MIFLDPHQTKLFDAVCNAYCLTDKQADQIRIYIDMLLSYNQKFNLTALTDITDVITYHIEDALAVTRAVDLGAARAFADVGSGGGVPGIPLAIMYPELSCYLIEVQQKKINFLQLVMQELGLVNGYVCGQDWRTFLRDSAYPIDLVCARASLQPDELMRMFRPSTAYRDGLLVYWAAATWQPTEKEATFVFEQRPYHVGNKDRKFVLCSKDGKHHQLALSEGENR